MSLAEALATESVKWMAIFKTCHKLKPSHLHGRGYTLKNKTKKNPTAAISDGKSPDQKACVGA